MNQPTKEQIREFWELLLNWEYRYYEPIYGSSVPKSGWYLGDVFKCNELPPIDLNNLFRHAVTKFKTPYISFESEGNKLYCYGKYNEGEYPCGCPSEVHLEASVEINDMSYDKACALALFWAIYQVRKGEVNDKADR